MNIPSQYQISGPIGNKNLQQWLGRQLA